MNRPEMIWSNRSFFSSLAGLGRLRVISQCGPSTFEALIDFGSFGLDRGYMNAITPEYHWHLQLDRFGWVSSGDTIHGRSGRRVFWFQLSETAASVPFLSIYLHREKGEEFSPERINAFQAMHRHLADGVSLVSEESI